MRRFALLWLLIAPAACTSDPELFDGGVGVDANGGGRDAVASVDATPGADVMAGMDATTPVDTGVNADAAIVADTGVVTDAGTSTASPQASFFVTSEGNGANGANYGGLAGADARCQSLAQAVGLGAKTWRAYLSVAGNGVQTVNARDRIGTGPWYNVEGVQVAADLTSLHTNGISYTLMRTERGDRPPANEHDILTGSQPDGNAFTSFPGNPAAPPPNCANWTSNAEDTASYVGHADWDDPATGGNPHWISSHDTGCSQTRLNATAGSGRLYCFAID